MKYRFRSLLVLAALTATLSQAHATFVFTLSQVGPNVVVSGSGTLNLSALTFGTTVGGYTPNIVPNVATLDIGPTGSSASSYFSGVNGPTSFGSGGQTSAVSGSGNFVGIQNSGFIIVPSGYISGSSLLDTATFNNATFGSLGFTPGTYTYTWGTGPNADSLTVTGAVPEPSTWALCGIGAGMLALLLRRRPAGRGRSGHRFHP